MKTIVTSEINVIVNDNSVSNFQFESIEYPAVSLVKTTVRSQITKQNKTEFIVLPENKHKIDINTEQFRPGSIKKP